MNVIIIWPIILENVPIHRFYYYIIVAVLEWNDEPTQSLVIG